LKGKDESAELAFWRAGWARLIKPRNRSWIIKVHASSWHTWHNKKMSHHPEGDHEFFDFTMHTNTLRVFFAPNCRF